MGELFVEGPEAGAALAAALVDEPAGARRSGRAHYSMIVAPDGGIIDDLIVYRLGEERFLVVANASNAAGRLRRPRRAARRLHGDPRRPAPRDRPRRDPGTRARRDPPAADRRRPRRAALLRHRRGLRGRHPGARRPDRLHGRGRLRGLRRDRHGPASCGTPCSPPGGPADGRPGRPRRPRHAPARGRHAPLRQRARPPTRTRTTRASAAWSSSTSPATSSVARRSSGSRPTGPAKRLVGLVVEGRGIARHGYPVPAATARPASSRAARSRRRSACRSRWPTSRRAMRSRVRYWTWRSATRRSPPRSSPLPFYRRPA